MRQVNRDELTYVISCALRAAPRGLVRGMLNSRGEESGRARTIIARQIVDTALNRYEVLCAHPLSETMGEQVYTIPVTRLLGEEPAPLTYADD